METLVVIVSVITTALIGLYMGYDAGKDQGFKEGLHKGYMVGKGTDNLLKCNGCIFETEDDEPDCVVCSRAYSDCYRKKESR